MGWMYTEKLRETPKEALNARLWYGVLGSSTNSSC
jgi:hypothetical protein